MRPRIETAVRFCVTPDCQHIIPRRAHDGPKRYSERLYCGDSCKRKHSKPPVTTTPRPKQSYRNSSRLVARVAQDLFFTGHLKQYEIARMFGVAPSSVSRMISGQSWGER